MIYVVIPTYQERDTIMDTVRAVLALPIACRVIVVDDDSSDGTKERLAELASGYPDRFRAINRPPPRSFAGSYIDGFAQALAEPDCEAVIECDADGSHPVDRMPEMVQLLQDADLVIGSRYVPGGNIDGFSRDRLALSSWANRYMRWATGMGIHDITAGFVAYRAPFLKELAYPGIRSNGYAFQIEMKRMASHANARMTEVPIRFADRSKGHSKMSFHTILEAFLLGLKYRLHLS